jgi:hypothetical protein
MLDKNRQQAIDRLLSETDEKDFTSILLEADNIALKSYSKKSNAPTEISRRKYILNKRAINKYLTEKGVNLQLEITPEESTYYYEEGQKAITEKKDDIEITVDLLQKIKSYKNIVLPPYDTVKELYNAKQNTSTPRKELLNNVTRICIYLSVVSGRRINEWLKPMQLSADRTHVSFHKSKSNNTNGVFLPLIPTDEFMDLYQMVEPYLQVVEVKAFTNRVNRYLASDKLTSHSLRKAYALLFSELQPNLTREAAIKECLNHENIQSALHYKNIKFDDKIFDDGKCLYCGIEVTKKNQKRHLTTKRHLGNVDNLKKL